MENRFAYQAKPMQYLYQAAILNEKGLALMESGKQHEAFETFIGALESITSLTCALEANRSNHCKHLSFSSSSRERKQRADRADGSSSCILFDDVKFDSHQLTSSLMNQYGSSSTSQGIVDSNSYHDINPEPSDNFVYNYAFRFKASCEMALYEHHCVQDNATCAHYINLYRAILTFNAALTFHQRSVGAEESVRRTADAAASNLYLHTLDLLQKCCSTPDRFRVLAATLNNIAILFYEMQDFAKFEYFQNELHLLLVHMESTFPKSVHPRVLISLFFNATLLTPPRTAGAA